MKYSAKVSTKVITSSGHAIITTIEGANIEDLTIEELSAHQSLCNECLNPLEVGEEVVVFEISKFNPSCSISLTEPHLIHIKNKYGKVCLEDFIARLLQSTREKEVKEDNPPLPSPSPSASI